MNAGCTDPQMAELVGAYMLGACPPAEADAVHGHIATCDACAREAASLTVARDALLTDVARRPAPPELKARVMAQVRADAELFAAAGDRHADSVASAPAARAEPARRRLGNWLRSPRQLAAAASAALALVVGGALIGGALGGDEGGAGTRTVLGSVDRAVAPGGGAKVVIDDAGNNRLIVSGLPSPGSRRVYQVWLRTGKDAPVPTRALFSVLADGSGEAVVPGDLKGVDQVLVTSEPEGGSAQPTRAPLVAISV